MLTTLFARRCDAVETCGRGQFMDGTQCVGCPLDTYQDIDTHQRPQCTKQETCGPGQRAYMVSNGRMGEYTPGSADASTQKLRCLPCLKNTFQPSTSVDHRKTCLPCPDGMSQATEGQQQCRVIGQTSCGSTEYLEGGKCKPKQMCGRGQLFTDGTGAGTCTFCTDGM